MLTLYRQLLRLYPAEHRETFGKEMMTVLAEAHRESANRKIVTRTRVVIRESIGLIAGAFRERFRSPVIIQDELSFVGGRCLMRNGFRFPKSTIVFMALLLAGVVLAIKRGEDIAASLSQVNPQIAPIQPAHSTLLSPIALSLAVFYGLGLIGWAILFAFRRSGMHRLADVSGERK